MLEELRNGDRSVLGPRCHHDLRQHLFDRRVPAQVSGFDILGEHRGQHRLGIRTDCKRIRSCHAGARADSTQSVREHLDGI